ncbi:GNAT family N-acetyltransferase [Flavobacterium frigidarium]|uniref:GNAT family N-acetyltransferase n=1 Tax=Flavobacterium frigidarium TaxID=99286 RepID=A0ABV4KC86_9FLAO
MSKKVQLENNEKEGVFYIEENDDVLGKMIFRHTAANQITIDHTEVTDDETGKGLGEEMVTEAVNFARKKGITIVPSCPFVAHVFDKTPDFKDVL